MPSATHAPTVLDLAGMLKQRDVGKGCWGMTASNASFTEQIHHHHHHHHHQLMCAHVATTKQAERYATIHRQMAVDC